MSIRFGTKKTFTTWLYSWVTVVVLIIICVFLALSVWERFVVEREMAVRREQAESAHSELSEQREALQDRVDYLSGERGVEEELRRNFDVARPGEQVVVLTGNAPADASTSTDSESPPAPWYIFWH